MLAFSLGSMERSQKETDQNCYKECVRSRLPQSRTQVRSKQRRREDCRDEEKETESIFSTQTH